MPPLPEQYLPQEPISTDPNQRLKEFKERAMQETEKAILNAQKQNQRRKIQTDPNIDISPPADLSNIPQTQLPSDQDFEDIQLTRPNLEPTNLPNSK